MPTIRADIVDVYVFRRDARAVELLQLLRADEPGSTLSNTWHPVMGHVEPGETAIACARRELHEELGLQPTDPAFRGLWALEQVHPYFIAATDQIVLSPRFACEVQHGWQPRLNDEHTAARWVPADESEEWFMWPGQIAAVDEIVRSLLAEGSLSRARLRVDL